MRCRLSAPSLAALVALTGCTVGETPTTVSEWAQTMHQLDRDRLDVVRRSAESLPCVEGTAPAARCADLVADARAFGQRVDEVLPAGDPPEQLEAVVTATRRFVDQIATRADAYDEACSGATTTAAFTRSATCTCR